MPRANLNDLVAFLAVARERSFTRAAARLGVSQSALSHAMRGLEARLGVRLLTRTTRSVSPTQAGERLRTAIGPHFEQIDAELDALSALRDKATGKIRITAAMHAASTVVWPKLPKFAKQHPEIHVELNVEYGRIDIAAQGFDAGVRIGEHIAKDMVAVRIGPDFRMVVVATPAYFKTRPLPKTPKDLTDHNCINLRLPTLGGLYAWEFEKGKRQMNVRVEGQLVFNSSDSLLQAALAGLGVAYLPEDMVEAHLESGRLQKVLDDWCHPFTGYHLYYPGRRQLSPAFSLLVDALRYKP